MSDQFFEQPMSSSPYEDCGVLQGSHEGQVYPVGPINLQLRVTLETEQIPRRGDLFPDQVGQQTLTRQGYDLALRKVCQSPGMNTASIMIDTLRLSNLFR